MGVITLLLFGILLPIAIASIVSILLAPKPEKSEPGKQRVNLPTATEGRPYPVLFGCRMIRGLNAVSSWLFLYAEYVSYHDETAANIYSGSFHVGVCNCLDWIEQLWWGGQNCWPGVGAPDTYAGAKYTTFTLPYAAAWLWGDWAYGGPGGVSGTIDVLYGDSDQTLNAYLASKYGATHPHYKGFVSMVFRGPSYWEAAAAEACYFGTSPQLRPIAVLGKRTDQFCDRTDMWYSAKAAIGTYNDMNPAHMVYEWLTSSLIGRGISTSLIGDTFEDVADTLYDEGFGLSCVWDYSPDDIESMIGKVEEIVDGKMYFDYATERYEFGLNRPDYTPGDLDTYDESDFWVESAGYLSPGRLPSKVVVAWEHRQYEGKRLAYDDDIALLAKQNSISNVEEYDYSGFVVDGDLANDIASRQQYAFSSMPKRFTLRCLRTMSQLHETSVFKISYPTLNISSMIVRLISIDRGSLADCECVIECIEDVFGQAYTVYGTPPEPEVGPAELESNITGDSLELTDSVTIVIDYGAYPYDSLGLTDYVTIVIDYGVNPNDSVGIGEDVSVTIS